MIFKMETRISQMEVFVPAIRTAGMHSVAEAQRQY
jgi:hypothetical protein